MLLRVESAAAYTDFWWLTKMILNIVSTMASPYVHFASGKACEENNQIPPYANLPAIYLAHLQRSYKSNESKGVQHASAHQTHTGSSKHTLHSFRSREDANLRHVLSSIANVRFDVSSKIM